MTVMLDQNDVEAFVSLRHMDLAARPIGALLPEPWRIGEVATKLAEAYSLSSEFEPIELYHIVRSAGQLYYGIERYGLDFEELCHLAGLEVARVVSVLTPDGRLPMPHRRMDWAARFSGSDATTRLVKMAEMVAVLEHWELCCPEDADLLPHIAYHQWWLTCGTEALTHLRRTFQHSRLSRACLQLQQRLQEFRLRLESAAP